MRWIYALIAFLAVLGLTAGAPGDYIQHIYTPPSCGTVFDPTLECYSIYNVSNPTNKILPINSSNFVVFFRGQTSSILTDKIPELLTSRVEYFAGGEWREFNTSKGTYNFPAHSWYYVKVSGFKKWVPTGTFGEETLAPVDNVLSAFDHNFTEYSWWNTTWLYRRQINITSAGNPAYTDFSANLTFDSNTSIMAGKMNNDCSDLRFTVPYNSTVDNETAVPYFLYADVGLYGSSVGKCAGGNYNATAIVKLPSVSNSTNNTIYFYYGYASAPAATNPYAAMFFYDGTQTTAWNQTLLMNDTSGGATPSENCAAANCYRAGLNTTIEPTGAAYVGAWLRTTKYNVTNLPIGNTMFMFFFRGVSPTTRLGFNSTVALALGGNKITLVRIKFNATGGRCSYENATGGDCAVIAGAPGSAKAHYLKIEAYNPGINTIQNYSAFHEPLNAFVYSGSAEVNSSGGGGPGTDNQITVYGFDEGTAAQLGYFNATFSNGTSTLTTPNGAYYSATWSTFPQGTNTVTFRNVSYYARTYQNVSIYNGTFNISGWLLPIAGPTVALRAIYVQSIASVPIAGALVDVQRQIGGVWTTIANCLTDTIGACSFYLDTSIQYLFTASASGYNSKSVYITPIEASYAIVLTGGFNPTYVPDYAGISQTLYPDYLNINRTWTVINYTISAANGDLTLSGFNISLGNGTLLYWNTSANLTGGTYLFNLSTVGKTGNVSVIGYFQKLGRPLQQYTKIYFIIGNGTNPPWSLSNVAQELQGAGGGFSIGIFIVLLAVVIVSSITRYMPVVVGGGILAVVVLAFLAFFFYAESSPIWIMLAGLGLFAVFLAKIKSGQ